MKNLRDHAPYMVFTILLVLFLGTGSLIGCMFYGDTTQTETEKTTTTEAVETIVSSTKASDAIKEQIKTFEGFSPRAIWDNGAYTLGYGHRDEAIKEDDTITEEEADNLFEEDIVCFEKAVVHFATEHQLVFTQNEFDALVSFLFNLGENYLQVIEERSQTDSRYVLINYLTSGEYSEDEMVAEWTSYCHSNGTVLQGLVTRRTYEVNLFLYGKY